MNGKLNRIDWIFSPSYLDCHILRVSFAIEDPTVGVDALGDGHEVVGTSVEVDQIYHVGEGAGHPHSVGVGERVVEVVEELPEGLDLQVRNF